MGCFLWVLFLAVALHWGKKIINEQLTRLVPLLAGLLLIGFGAYFLHRTSVLIFLESLLHSRTAAIIHRDEDDG